MTDNDPDRGFMALAFEQARASYDEGGLPIGAVMVEGDTIIGRGHNRRVQDGDPTAHGEMSCLRNTGRRASYAGVTMYTTLSPCMMCAGTMVQFGIRRVVIGENRNFEGNVPFLRDNGVEVRVLDDADCTELMGRFIRERPRLWAEDIAGNAPEFPKEGMALTHILVVRDVGRSKSFYAGVLGAEVYREYGGTSCVLQFAGAWLLLVTGGGPTPDKPDTVFEAPPDPDSVSHAMTIRVEDCQEAYEVLSGRGAVFLTPPYDWGGEVRCFFRDPDGHLLEISEARSQSANAQRA